MDRVTIKQKIAAGCAALALGVFSPAMAAADSLAAVLTDAYNNSGLLEQNQALLRAADEDVASAVAALRPIISWSGDVTHSRRRSSSAAPLLAPSSSSGTSASLGLSADLLLYDGGRTPLQAEIAKEAVLATRQSLVSIEQRVLFQALQAYIGIRTSSETVALRQNNVNVITEELRAAKDRFEVGEVTRTDVAQAEARLAQARAAFASAQGDLATSRETFIAAVGRKPGRLQAPPAAPATANSMDAAKAIALRSHPDVLAAQHNVTATDLQVKVAELAVSPTINLRGNLGLTENFNSPDFSKSGSVSLSVSGPIYRGGQLDSARRRAIARRDAQRSNLHVTGLTVAQDAGTAFASLQVAKAAREASDRQVRFARVAFRGVREEATLGARTTLDVLNAEQELLDAQANLISTSGNEFLASYVLLANMGLLTADHLKLRVTKYDPAAYYNLVKDAPVSISKQGQKLDHILKTLGKE